MQFIDKTDIYIKAGNGGDGCAAFHREKYVPKGGPSGGDGGKGGSVIFVADPQDTTLLAFKRAVHFRAENGENGRAELQHGKDGADLYIRVPVGTIVRDVETGSILADIPGLIEGAAEGAGLGHDFLRHIERTRILLHVIDASGSELRDPLEDYAKINAELAGFSDALASLPQIVCCNKMDLPEAEENLARIRTVLEPENIPVFGVSAATVQGFDAMLDCIISMLDTLPPVRVYDEAELTPQGADQGFTVRRDDDGSFIVEGGDVDRLLETTDPDDETSMRRFQQLLIKTGIIAALREMGAKDGDTIVLGEWDFTFTE